MTAGASRLLPAVVERARQCASGWSAAPATGAPRHPSLAELLGAGSLALALEEGCRRRGSEDRVAVGSVLVGDLLVPVVRLSVVAWSVDRVVLDVSPANLAVDLTGSQPRLALIEPRGFGPCDDDDVLDRFEETVLDGTVTATVDALRRVERVGRRHLWGSVALAVVNTLASLSHRPGSRADADRVALLARRPDLARTLDVVTVDDAAGGEITYAIRRTCCLLVKLPGSTRCGTCSLRPREERITACDQHYRAERATLRR